MKKNSENDINNSLNDFPDYLVKLICESLDKADFSKILIARETLVKMGKKIIPQIHKLLSSENDSLRMEPPR